MLIPALLIEFMPATAELDLLGDELVCTSRIFSIG